MAQAGPRRQAREAALQVLFAADVSHKLPGEAFEDVLRSFSLPTRARSRARDLVLGVSRNLAQIDAHIGSSSEHWKVSRLATVDRNILRIATYELLFEPVVPTEVILDEAIEIARRFAGETSRAFVNGVLDVIAREVRGAAA
jgi:transcription antitermination protein NusB